MSVSVNKIKNCYTQRIFEMFYSLFSFFFQDLNRFFLRDLVAILSLKMDKGISLIT